MLSSNKKIRLATHAGSWYVDDGKKLSLQLQQWIDKVKINNNNFIKAIISPHAGYSYSGQTAAYSFKNLDKTKIKKIFVLGPSHQAYLNKCALSCMDEYETPLGNISIDKEINKELYNTKLFDWMKQKVDEEEHSIEMQLPYIMKMMEGVSFTLIPILVGNLSEESEEQYGKIFTKYLEDPTTFFVISSDFCHWGKRFDYYYYEKELGPIYKFIEILDKRGIEAIESSDPNQFYSYQKKYQNTICGRHPIGILLQTIQFSKLKFEIKFIYYTQSNQCSCQKDSSVSYASGIISQLS
jgi:AmmeMemoRadiSam system protein B